MFWGADLEAALGSGRRQTTPPLWRSTAPETDWTEIRNGRHRMKSSTVTLSMLWVFVSLHVYVHVGVSYLCSGDARMTSTS